jgi:uncharacterized protein (DUF302 family)
MNQTSKLLLVFFSGVLLAGIVGFLMAPGMMIHEVVSPYGVEETVTKITENAVKLGWTVTKTYDFQKSIQTQANLDVGPVRLIELCKAEHAKGLLMDDDAKFVSVMMPCAVSVYQKKNGKVYIASMNVGLMGKLFGGKIAETMGKVSVEDQQILKM